METKVLVTDVVALGRGLGGTAFSEQAALTTLGSKVCRMTGVVMVLRRPVVAVVALLLEVDDDVVALIIMAVVVFRSAAVM